MKNNIIIGGGFYGLYIAEYLAKKGHAVHLFDEALDFMQRASFNNQARVHNGYHYPRSTLTALRSRISYPVFLKEFKDSVYLDFKKYYMVGQPLGKISAYQFEQFCKRIKAPCKAASPEIWDYVDRRYISGIYETEEVAFDAVKLKNTMLIRALNAGVILNNGTKVNRIEKLSCGKINVFSESIDGEAMVYTVDQVFNCTYSNINQINLNSSIEVIPLRHELTEMCLVKLPTEIEKLSFTVMCGPFFSIMPFPSTKFSTFSHVRYTPHFDWNDRKNEPIYSSNKVLEDNHPTNWRRMVNDGTRYMPILKGCKYQTSLWETKTILPASDRDDSRPILFKSNYVIKGYHCVMGGKIDNIYDVINMIKKYELDR
ncbi:amino acid oxidase [Enterovibrio norvegicus FF-454]|uniref:Amino acid oxidase n=1 Tax=Enterovibrio norvegicus FF-454 TaxID=1185651 RepID=A0A1E5C6D5_9GAMM|nr:FAD-dependent oxidoreductase [Enterovibrio norvegicus]OEE61101.1 amino acid oxidase [Enterovibrio norvegicus FF-454]